MNSQAEPIKLLTEEPTINLFAPLKDFAEYITNSVLTCQEVLSGTPVLISGDWGAGKTSVLKYIKNELDKNKTQELTYVFDAWHYENEPSLIAALTSGLWHKYKKDAPITEAIFAFTKACLSISTRLVGNYFGVKNLTFDAIQKDFDSFPDAQKKALLTIETDELRKYFFEIIADISKGKSLTIIIDDLDRCSPEKAIVLIEQIRQLVAQKPPEGLVVRFIVLMDHTTLAEAVSNKYSDLSSYDSNRYLEKVFPLSFEVPKPNKAAINSLLVHGLNNLNNVAQTNINANSAQITTILSKPIYANPRLFKRCLNKLSLLLHFEQSKSSQQQEITDSLIHWIAATERWPLIRKLLWRKEQNFWTQLQAHIRENKPLTDKDGEDLLKQPGVRELLGKIAESDFLTRITEFEEEDERLRNAGL